MEPASDQLVEPPRREGTQIDELADARQVERRVSREGLRGDVPEKSSKHEPCESRGVSALDRTLFATGAA
jgi:hypothetical protein